MKPKLTILEGDVLTRLAEMPSESVQTIVTSPPYWGLRDYGIQASTWPDGWVGCLGLEPTPEMFVDHVVMVFNEAKRVLKNDGTLWLNMGDTYSSNAGGYDDNGSRGKTSHPRIGKGTMAAVVKNRSRTPTTGLRAKNLIGIPWRCAFALQAAGWNLRCDIIWHKPNPMPESCKDRPTKAHEYIFLFSKSRRYYYDYKAIREPVTGNAHARGHGVNPKAGNGAERRPSGWSDAKNGHKTALGWASANQQGRGKKHGKNSRMNVTRDVEHATRPKQNASFSAAVSGLVSERNKRSVWTVPTFAFEEAHYATFPPELIRPCIRAGAPKGAVVLDPFLGSGTTAMVAIEEGREAVGIEKSPENVAMAHRRCTASKLDRHRMLYQDRELEALPLFPKA